MGVGLGCGQRSCFFPWLCGQLAASCGQLFTTLPALRGVKSLPLCSTLLGFFFPDFFFLKMKVGGKWDKGGEAPHLPKSQRGEGAGSPWSGTVNWERLVAWPRGRSIHCLFLDF